MLHHQPVVAASTSLREFPTPAIGFSNFGFFISVLFRTISPSSRRRQSGSPARERAEEEEEEEEARRSSASTRVCACVLERDCACIFACWCACARWTQTGLPRMDYPRARGARCSGEQVRSRPYLLKRVCETDNRSCGWSAIRGGYVTFIGSLVTPIGPSTC